MLKIHVPLIRPANDGDGKTMYKLLRKNLKSIIQEYNIESK